MIVTAQVEQIFWDTGHWMNDVLAERFGVIDEDGLRIYNPTKAEMREQLEILRVESRDIKHRINNNEMNPKTECGLELGNESPRLAWANEPPTCKDCLAKEA